MTPQEAYNLGLDAAEKHVCAIFEKILRNEEAEPFMNPLLEAIRKALQERSDYYWKYSQRNNNPSKYFRKMIQEQLQHIDNSKP